MRQAVVDLVVADGGYVGPHQIHNADGGGALVLRVDDAAPEHIPRHGVDHVFLLPPHLVDIAGKQRYAAHQPLVDLLGEEIAVHIVGVQDRQLLQVLHTPLLSSAAEHFSACCSPLSGTAHGAAPRCRQNVPPFLSVHAEPVHLWEADVKPGGYHLCVPMRQKNITFILL